MKTFNCPGEVNPKVLEKIHSKPEPPVWINDGEFAAGRPNQADLDRLSEKIRRLL